MAPLKKIKVKSIPKPGPGVKQYRPLAILLYALGVLAIIFGILYGGPALSRFLIESDRKAADKNGAIVKAVIYRKSSHKGRTIYFKYTYKGTQYKNSEGNRELYDKLTYGDVILIKIDTLAPETSYVLTN